MKEIRRSQPCKAEFLVDKLHQAYVDGALINQVWINLISNAVKYSGKNDHPVVSIGSYMENDEVIFYVKDNGAEDLTWTMPINFLVYFKDCTGQKEYEGTGIGLAIVYRVITRHKGRVWAEGKVNEGSSLLFFVACVHMISKCARPLLRL